MLPVGLMVDKLLSACASNHNTRSFFPARRQCAATALIEPMARQ
jgi:hypothetical protein